VALSLPPVAIHFPVRTEVAVVRLASKVEQGGTSAGKASEAEAEVEEETGYRNKTRRRDE
jgi:hypothetical protein